VASYPRLVQTVLDATDVRGLAEFYRQLLGLRYRPGDEPTDEETESPDWLVLRDAADVNRLAFQQVERLELTTWPAPDIPMQLHLDLSVPDEEDLERQRERAESLGARLRLDRSTDPAEPCYVLTDPAGHPFCIFVA
jgi:catechol 2,3-dioxygenase-like lactoylglutathione lyase family enzyme